MTDQRMSVAPSGIGWKDVGQAVATVAPALAGALGGPLGAVAAAAGNLLAAALGQKPDPEAVASAVQNPEALVRLRELENAEQDRLLAWQERQLDAEAANAASARQREVELARSGHGAAWATSIVATIVTIGFFAMLWMVLANGAGVSEAGLLLLGSLSTAFGAVINYYLGSSLSSAQKTGMLVEKRA